MTKENEKVVNASKRKSNNEDTVKETETKKLREEEQSVLRQSQMRFMNCYFETVADEVNELCSISNNDHAPGKARKISGLIVMSAINTPMKFVHLTVPGKILEKIVGCVIKISNSILLKKKHMRKVITIYNIT